MTNTKPTIPKKDTAHLGRIRLREAGELNAPRRYPRVRSDSDDEALGSAEKNERWLKQWKRVMTAKKKAKRS